MPHGSADCLLSPLPVLEKIRSAVGSAQLLMSQKVQQFYRLCQQNMVSARQWCHGVSHGQWERDLVMPWGQRSPSSEVAG